MKTILVTGASAGIGRALAVRAARAGYAVYAVGRNVEALATLAEQVSEEGGTIATDAVDVSDPANTPGLIGRMTGAFGRIDVLVNNAGAVAVGPLAAQSDEALRAQFGTHVVGPLALVREALPALRASLGHVFMLGSGVARVPVGGLGAYPPSKAALRSATAILRRELAPLDIAVTYVDPGAVDTAFMRRAGLNGAPPNMLVSPELVARKILLTVGTSLRTLNVAPLQTAAIAVAELLPVLTEAILERHPSLIGGGPTLAAIEFERDTHGRAEKIALPRALSLTSSSAPSAPEPPAAHDAEPEAPENEPQRHEQSGADEQLEALAQPRSETAAEPERDLDAQPEPEEQRQTAKQVGNGIAGAKQAHEPAPHAGPPLAPAHLDDDDATVDATSKFEVALEPLRRRMERAKLDPGFVRALLIPDTVLDVGEAAMHWAGMPNKHERALTSEIFFALAEWGFLAPRADGRYRVLAAPDDEES